jgi:hypothetical protein
LLPVADLLLLACLPLVRGQLAALKRTLRRHGQWPLVPARRLAKEQTPALPRRPAIGRARACRGAPWRREIPSRASFPSSSAPFGRKA